MANPRQRRKARSSFKRVTQSLRSRKNMKKPPPVKAPKVLQDAWDPKKTVRQNYAAMGLMHNLNPTSSGGVEVHRSTGVNDSSSSARTLEDVEAEPPMPARALPKGFGRIIRDESGNVIDVELPEDEDEAGGTVAEAPVAVDNGEWQGVAEMSGWVTALRGTGAKGGESEVVQQLGRMVAVKPVRHTSDGERGYLRRLAEKHGNDVDAMARDTRLNVQQNTAGQLRKALKKAKLVEC